MFVRSLLLIMFRIYLYVYKCCCIMSIQHKFHISGGGICHGVAAKPLDSRLGVSGFELQSYYRLIAIIIIQADCRFWYERAYFFLPPALSDTRRETQIIRVYTDPKPSPPRAVHLQVSKISTHFCRARAKLICFDTIGKTQLPPLTVVPELVVFFKILKFSGSLPGVTSSTHIINSNGASIPISCQGVYYDRWWLSYPFRVGFWEVWEE